MAKRFHFDDEDTQDYDEESYIDELEKMKTPSTSSYESLNQEVKEELTVAKKKKKMQWWHYMLIAIATLIVVFFVYIFALTNNDGPVYGPRCEGLTTDITSDQMSKVSSFIKQEYTTVEDVSLEVNCKQVKIDIVFKDGTSTKKAKKIAEATVLQLDKVVGKPVEEGHTYSPLFGYDKNEPQYEVNLFMECKDNKDFPIYATKHVSSDQFAYTLSSIKDEDSHDKAKDSLKK